MNYFTWITALAVTLAVGFVAANESDDWTQSADLQEVQLSQAAAAKRVKGAQALCVHERGQGALVLWTIDGDIVCRSKP